MRASYGVAETVTCRGTLPECGADDALEHSIKKEENMNKKSLIIRIVCCVFMAILVAAIIVANAIAWEYEDAIDSLLTQPVPDPEAAQKAQAAGKAMAIQVETDGAVLLRNENNTLPLDTQTDRKVNIFGYGSVEWSFGALGNGTSGMVRPESGTDRKDFIDLCRALTRYGISYNAALQNFYRSWCEPAFENIDANSLDKDLVMTLCEPDISAYSQELLADAEAYSDTAIVVLSRLATESRDQKSYQPKRGTGQNSDTGRHFLQISTEEESMLRYVGSHYEKVVVLINSANAMELGFLETIPGLDACMYVGFTGIYGATAIPQLLYGASAPSGRTADTYPYSNTLSPAGWGNWFGSGTYANGGYGTDYIEGIYVGYKWWETADAEGVWDNIDNEYGTGYDGVVQYPFGYGLSYTTFDWDVTSVTPSAGSEIKPGDKITVEVNVTNTGSAAGRDVVEAYVTVPYDKAGDGIEKSYVSLVGFAKTDTLVPEASQVVKVEIEVEDFESYDCYDKNDNGFCGYELEAGQYEVKLMTDAHNIKEVSVNGGAKQEGKFVFNVSQTVEIELDPVTQQPVGNLFTGKDAIDGYALDGIETDETGAGYNANIPFMSRKDFAPGYTIPERTGEVRNRALSEKAAEALAYTAEKAAAWDEAETDAFGNPTNRNPVTWGVDSGLRIVDGQGKLTEVGKALASDYTHGDWTTLLNQVTFNEAKTLIGPARMGNAAVNSVGKPRLISYDSVVQVKGYAGTPRGTGFPSSIVLAQTFDQTLMYQFGLNYGNEMVSLSVNNIFGPGVNIHRSAFSGRSWEYLSEDTYLTTVAGCMLVRGIQNRGRGVELKHFLLNEQEDGRFCCRTFLSEQALREIYLTPFRKAVTRENATGIMTSYNAVGANWAGGSEALMLGVLRGEWKFRGTVDTDWTADSTGRCGTIDEQLRSGGGDLGMAAGLGGGDLGLTYEQSTASNRLQNQMREAVHHVLYGYVSALAQGEAYALNPDEGFSSIVSLRIDGWKWWPLLLATLDLVVGFGCAVWLFLLFFPKGKKKEEPDPALAAVGTTEVSASTGGSDDVFALASGEETTKAAEEEKQAESKPAEEKEEATSPEQPANKQAEPEEKEEATSPEQLVNKQAKPADSKQAKPEEKEEATSPEQPDSKRTKSADSKGKKGGKR